MKKLDEILVILKSGNFKISQDNYLALTIEFVLNLNLDYLSRNYDS
jgi:hypothetical protein